MRVVNLNFEQKDLEELSEVLYVEGCSAYAIEIAIGYLSTWNLNYPFVDIIISAKNGEFTACYQKELDGSTHYLIGAVFNKQTKKFGFHS